MSPSDALGTLVAAPGVPGIEVTVYDGRLRRIPPDEASGEYLWRVPRGIYKVRYQAGSALNEHIVTVDQTETTVYAPPAQLEFTSSAPLHQTVSSHEYHTAPAVEMSRKAPLDLGRGATLFAMVRSRGGPFLRQSPEKGLTLKRNRETVFDFTALERDPENTCGAIHLALDPGAYILECDTGACRTSQTIFVTEGWQTQLFISEAAENAPTPLDLPGLAVLMARPGEGFDPTGYGLHMVELARKALTRGRSAMSPKQVRELLEDKFQNPMLGIFGAHLLLLRSSSHPEGIARVLEHLERLAPGHPDAACLRLSFEPTAKISVTAPPMLARSWDLLVNASVTGAQQLESSLGEVAAALWDTGGAWLTWGEITQKRETHPGHGRTVARGLPGVLGGLLGAGLSTGGLAFRAEPAGRIASRILRFAAEEARPDEADPGFARIRDLARDEPLGSALVDEFDLTDAEAAFINVVTVAYGQSGSAGVTPASLARRLRMPASIVRQTARRLADRLDRSAS